MIYIIFIISILLHELGHIIIGLLFVVVGGSTLFKNLLDNEFNQDKDEDSSEDDSSEEFEESIKHLDKKTRKKMKKERNDSRNFRDRKAAPVQEENENQIFSTRSISKRRNRW